MNSRKSGILLHITSLPSPYGIGDLGPGAGEFADFLLRSGQSIWQILPLNPSSPICGNSPYCSYSAFAGNPLLISPELLVHDGFLLESDIENPPRFRDDRVDFGAVADYKNSLLRTAAARYCPAHRRDDGFESFCFENAWWLDDYALFAGLKDHFHGRSWNRWPSEARDRAPEALAAWKEVLEDRILEHKFCQYVFFRQWERLKRCCNAEGIEIMGDIPIYVSYDSADVWANPEIFRLDDNREPALVAGVPPDYFSITGQLWGNPVYDWDVLRQTRYEWWIRRMEHNLTLFDRVRLDHFRGFVSYWAVPASEVTAVNGEWMNAPVRDFMNTLCQRFPGLPIVAEDLGIITPDVREIMDHYGFPGMKILHFAFGDDVATNPYAPHNYQANSVVYTGTHDNNTTRGWFRKEATPKEKKNLGRYVGRDVGDDDVHWELIRLAMMSVARIAVTPMQDFLGLGEESRMNMPSVVHGNWEWRMPPGQAGDALAEAVSEMTTIYGRTRDLRECVDSNTKAA